MAEKIYRPNVAAVVLSSEYPAQMKVFIGLRSDMKDVWQFPQGGIDEGESPREALLRELKEEIGTDNIEIISEYPEWEFYDFPDGAAKNKKLYNYKGQKQKYFLVRLKNDLEVDICTEHPEFNEFKFVKFETVFGFISHFKKPIYKKVLSHFKREGFI
jgi:putative (di)nucleoside polyphosphate hydrolase